MKGRFVPTAIIVALVLALAFATACGLGGGDEEMAPAEFLRQLGELDNQYVLQGEALADDASAKIAGASEQERLVATRDFVRETLRIFEEFVDAAGDLNAPADFVESHGRLMQARADAVQAWEDLLAQLEGVDSEAETKELVQAFFTGPAFKSLDKPCFAEQAIGIDLGCAETEE